MASSYSDPVIFDGTQNGGADIIACIYNIIFTTQAGMPVSRKSFINILKPA
jgi:hypothetical protein